MSRRALVAAERELVAEVTEARRAVSKALRASSPQLAKAVDAWATKRLRAARGKNFFIHPDAYPAFHLARWFAETHGVKPSRELTRTIQASNVAAAYFIRLLDDVMDAADPTARRLLPASVPLQFAIFRPYEIFFRKDGEAVETLRGLWAEHADDTYADAALTSIDESAFLRIVSRKFSAARMPLWAVARASRHVGALKPWFAFLRTFGAWHQMLNDTLDWRKDLAEGVTSYFLGLSPGGSHARVTRWVLTEGFERGAAIIERYGREVDRAAEALRCGQLHEFVKRRRAHCQSQLSDLRSAATNFRLLESSL